MQLSSLTLENFRSYRSLAVGFGDVVGTEIFVGQNGSGKTNILEALCMLSTAQSFLGVDADFLPTWGTDHFRVTGVLRADDGEEFTASVAWQRAPRRIKALAINDVRTSAAQFIGRVPVLAFLPSDLSLFTGAPGERRALLDAFLSLLSPSHVLTLREYEHGLKQRNVLLRAVAAGSAREHDLDPWDAHIARHGAVLRGARRRLLAALQDRVPQVAASLGEPAADVRLTYESKGTETEERAMERELQEHLAHYRPRDLLVGSTTVGAHRDDWMLSVDGHAVSVAGSRGQQRAYILALLFARTDLLTQARKERPIIVLDDVLSELDEHHHERLLHAVTGCQVFITTAHAPPVTPPRARYHSVSGGRVSPRGHAMEAAVEG